MDVSHYLPWIIGRVYQKDRGFDILYHVLWEKTLQEKQEMLVLSFNHKNKLLKYFLRHSLLPNQGSFLTCILETKL